MSLLYEESPARLCVNLKAELENQALIRRYVRYATFLIYFSLSQ